MLTQDVIAPAPTAAPKKVGRPKLYNAALQFTVSLKSGTIGKMDEFCASTGISRTALIRMAIEKFLEK